VDLRPITADDFNGCEVEDFSVFQAVSLIPSHSLSLASPAMRGRRRLVKTAFGGACRLSFFMGLTRRRTLFQRGRSDEGAEAAQG
jgi:hypothetical protein